MHKLLFHDSLGGMVSVSGEAKYFDDKVSSEYEVLTKKVCLSFNCFVGQC